eukprot:scaffold458095_cov28-Prasinocladus_malaysianus.AAC.1
MDQTGSACSQRLGAATYNAVAIFPPYNQPANQFHQQQLTFAPEDALCVRQCYSILSSNPKRPISP